MGKIARKSYYGHYLQNINCAAANHGVLWNIEECTMTIFMAMINLFLGGSFFVTRFYCPYTAKYVHISNDDPFTPNPQIEVENLTHMNRVKIRMNIDNNLVKVDKSYPHDSNFQETY